MFGVASVAGGLATALWPGWVLTAPGGIAFVAWNALVIAMAILTIIAMRQRRRPGMRRVIAETSGTRAATMTPR